MRRTSAALFQIAVCVAFCSDAAVWAEDAGTKAPAKQLADGTISLSARQVTIHGHTAYLRSRSFLSNSDICTWTNVDDWVSLNRPGEYLVDLRYSCADGSEGSTVEIADDRGLTGRELNGNTPVLFLTNAHEIYMGYRCSWLSGKPRQKYQFALLAHDGGWDSARVPQRAWEYNAPPLLVLGVEQADAKSFLQTSDNVVVEAMRRDGDFLEVWLVECLGHAGQAIKHLFPRSACERGRNKGHYHAP